MTVVIRSPGVVTVAAKGIQGRPGADYGGGRLSAPVDVGGGDLAVTLASPWGIDVNGNPYYDASGAVPAEAVTAFINDQGGITLGGASASSVESVNGHSGVVVLTKTDVGLSQVDNVSDVNKPLSTAATTALGLKADASALTAHTGNTSNPHAVTAAQVGLGSVNNTADSAKPVSTAQQTALNLKADDSTVVHLAGTETLTGVKTFSSAPVVPSGSFPESAVTNLVSDLAAKAADSAVVHNTGAETIAGVKTFSSAPIVPSGAFPESAITNLTTDLAAKATDSAVVHLTGTETIGGAKSFSSPPTVPTPTASGHAVTKAYADGLVISGAPDATTSSKGVVQLAGDLGGTAASPTVPGLASKASQSYATSRAVALAIVLGG